MNNTPLMVIALTVLAQASHADIIATYDFDGGSLAASSELFAGSAGDITLGANWSTSADGITALGDDISGSIAAASNGFSFVYTVMGLAAGETLSLDSASIDFTNSVGSTRMDFSDAGALSNTNPGLGDGTFTGPLTSTGLTNGSVVTILYGFRDGGTGAGQTYTLDNVVLNGTVTAAAVPEPGTFVLLAGFMGLTFARVRRRRS